MADVEERQRLARSLREYGYGVHSASDVAAAKPVLTCEPIDIIFWQTASTKDKALQELLAYGPTLFVLGAADAAHIELAEAALAAGAYDYLLAPHSAADLVLVLHKAAAREAYRGDFAAARFLALPARPLAPDKAASPSAFPELIAESPSMRALLEKLRRLATHNTAVLFTGESGTGKEVWAKTLHALSPRREKALVAVNCGALPENLLESLLFGHRRGAFTDAVRDQQGLFEQAHQGTLFLDEIGELPLKLQVKLLRVLQDQRILPLGAQSDEVISVDVRVVAATLRDLEDDVQRGRFRADLYYRLSVVPLHVPALRERVADILPLARHFLHRAARRIGRPLHGLTPAAQQVLLRHFWPGNVRELENVIERAVVLCEHTVLDAADLALDATPQGPDLGDGPGLLRIDADDLSLKTASRRLEIALIGRALRQTRGNRSAAARLLGLSHRALLYKIRDYGLGTPEKT